ncbi:phage portal protein [Palleronia caenipelagi]|uniref:Phage portal protein n=1 Tax=Palleronia caenipelagi TaxID=2489174 RepID=A0A547Q061_9RHOB|nr:phage portal protein [Palleronia caenipelagi]TRD19759.1 phage portal protein [Palleronia caenipelagi]
MFDFLKRAADSPEETKVSAAGKLSMPQIATGAMGRIGWTARDGASLMRAGFQGNPVVFRAVRMIAEAAAALPLVLEAEGRRMDTHPLLSLMKRPNGAQGQAELLEAIYGHILLTGNGYVEAVGDGSLPLELHVLRADRMSVVPGADGWTVGYDYSVAGRSHRFGAAQICHIRSFHPQDDHYGLSPLQSAAQSMDVHISAARWSKALLDNAARPSGAIVYQGGDGMLDPQHFDRLVAELEAHHQGARNAGRPMLLEGGLDWKPMGFSPSDMEFQKTKDAAAREIALAFGVPPMLLGIPGDATYANYAESNRAFYRLTVLPLAGRVAGALAHWMESFTGESLELRVDLDRVPALAAERDAQWERIAGADFLSDDEKRVLLGFGPKED